MWPENEDFEAHCTYEDAIAEVRAQIEKAEKMGMKPSHVDNHVGSLYGMNGRYLMLPKVFKVCGEKAIPSVCAESRRTSSAPTGSRSGFTAFSAAFPAQ